jgi:hypothetical protein
MTSTTLDALLTSETLLKIFPEERTDEFFEALFGDANEGSYDIELAYRDADDKNLTLELLLHERPNCCLACNLTQGLPQVFSRHPVIDVASIVRDIDNLIGDRGTCGEWSLGHTEQRSSSLHVIPIRITIQMT